MAEGYAARIVHDSRKALAVIVAIAPLVAGCSLTRSHVKGLRDPQAHQIQFDDPIPTTIKALNALPSHCGPAPDHRVRPEEFRVYQVVGRITRVKREPDHDIHVVLQDRDDPHEYLVTESGDPAFRGNAASPYRSELGAVRKMLDDLQHSAGAPELKDLEGLTVRVTGVGFFDFGHFQKGRSRSCIELHPILAIERVAGDAVVKDSLGQTASSVTSRVDSAEPVARQKYLNRR
jgi:hypothetical protein